jgi:hypothetical protein
MIAMVTAEVAMLSEIILDAVQPNLLARADGCIHEPVL